MNHVSLRAPSISQHHRHSQVSIALTALSSTPAYSLAVLSRCHIPNQHPLTFLTFLTMRCLRRKILLPNLKTLPLAM